MGLNWVGPGDHGLRHRRPEAAAPLGHRRRRRDLVPGLQRARGRLRPGLAPHPGRRGRRRLAHHRPEDLDLLRRHGAVVRAGGPGRARRAPRGHHDVPRPDGHARASRCGPSGRCSAPTTSTRCSSTTCGPAPTRCSAGSARAGRSSARRWPTSGSASRATPAASGCSRRSARSWRRTGTTCPPSLHTQWARALVQVRVARLLAYRTVHAQATGEFPDVLASSARIAVTQCDQAVAEVLFQAVEHEAVEAGTSAPAPRRHRGPLALRPGGHRRVRHDRGAAHDRVQGAAQRSRAREPAAARRGRRVRRRGRQGVRRRSAGSTPPAGPRTTRPAAPARWPARCGRSASTTSTRATTPTRWPRPPRSARRPVGSRSPTPSPRCSSRDADGRPFAAVPDGAARVDHGDLFDEWVVAPLAGPADAGPPGRRAARHPPRPVRRRPRSRRRGAGAHRRGRHRPRRAVPPHAHRGVRARHRATGPWSWPSST